MFSEAPGLRGLWYPGNQDNAGAIYDSSWQGRTLTYNGNPTLNYLANGVPYEDYDGTGDAHTRLTEAGLSITGLEATIAIALRGLTLGGWFWLDSIAASAGLVTKNLSTGNQRGYGVIWSITANAYILRISADGIAQVDLASSVGAPTAGRWYFIVGRFTPGAEMAIWENGTKTILAAGVPASIFVNTTHLSIGALNGITTLLDGRCAMAFLAASIWSDAIIQHCFVRTRNFFGV